MRLPTVFVPSLADIWEESIRASIASILPRYLQTCRWFRSGNRRFRSLEITEVVPIKAQTYQLIFLRAEYASGDPETYLLPVGCAQGDNLEELKARHTGSLLAQIQAGDKYAILFAATDDADFNSALLEAFARRKRFAGQHGTVLAERNKVFRKLWGGSHPDLTPQALPIAQVATSVRFGDRFVLKLLANIEPGIHPGLEMGDVLSEHVAPLAGFMEYQPKSGESTVLAMLHGFVPNQGNAWDKTLDELKQYFGRVHETDLSSSDELMASAPASIYDLAFSMAPPQTLAKELIGGYMGCAWGKGWRSCI
jgi:maltose alpha-D-glucosyltransferase/alpha-amylase